MPSQTVKSGLAGKLGAKVTEVLQENKDTEATYSGGGDCPAGIDNGVAKLVEFKFSQYKDGEMKGEYFMYAAGIVVAPDVHNGMPIKGLRTSIMEPLCDTPNRKRATAEDHVLWVQNEMKKLGVTPESVDDLETCAEALKEAAPYFRFRTWKGEATKEYPNPRVNHDWNGTKGLENWVPEEGDGGVVDETGDGEPAEEAPKAPPKPTSTAKKPAAAPATKPTTTKSAAKKPAPAPEPEPEPAAEDNNWDELAEQADNGDTDAQQALKAQCDLFNIDEEAVEQASNWTEVADLLKAAATEQEGGEPAEPEEAAAEWEPSVGDVVKFNPIDPKTKKPGKKAVECEVKTVDKNKKIVNLQNLDDKKQSYKGISWDSLTID